MQKSSPWQNVLDSLSESEWEQIDSLADRLDAAYRSGLSIPLSELMPAVDDPMRTATLVELIKADQEHQFIRGKAKHLEKYLAEWPELRLSQAATAELLAFECTTRAIHEGPLDPADVLARFPDSALMVDVESINIRAARESSAAHLIANTGSMPSEDTTSQAIPAPDLSIGQRFGDYEIREHLGTGGMGTVYRAYDTVLQREVALKLPRIDLTCDPAATTRFLEEGRAAARVDHRNVCRIYHAGCVDGRPFIAMALVQGMTLAQWRDGRMISCAQAAEVVRQIACAVEAVHQQGIVHRDIKPQNVMIGASGEPLLMDFGLARSHAAPQNGGRSSFRGTMPYAAPEAFFGGIASPAADIYGLGVLLYHLLAGAAPFDPLAGNLKWLIFNGHYTPLRDVRPDIDPQLEQICAKAMAREPAERFASADELAQALSAHLDDQKPSEVAPATSANAGKRRTYHRFLMAGFGLFGFLLVCGMFIWGIWRRERPPVKTLLTNVPRLPVQQWRADGGCMVMQFSPDGTKYYSVLNPAFPHGRTDTTCRLVIGDAKTGAIRFQQNLVEKWQSPRGLAVSKNGSVFISDFYAAQVARIREQSRGEIEYIPITLRTVERPLVSDITLTPDESALIAILGNDGQETDYNNDYVAIVDLNRSKLIELQLNDEPQSAGLCVASDGKKAYIATRRRKSKNATLYEVNLERPYSISRRAPIPCDILCGIAYCERKRCVFVGDSQNSVIWQVSRDTFTAKKWLSLGGYSPRLLAIDPTERTLAVDCKNQIILFDLETSRVKAYANNSSCTSLRFDPSGKRLFLPGSGADGVKFIDLNSPPSRDSTPAPRTKPHAPWRNVGERLDSFIFAAKREGESFHLYWTNAAANQPPTQLTFQLADDWAPAWSPSGDRIAFVSDRDGLPRVYVIDPVVGETKGFKKTHVSHWQKGNRTPVAWLPDETKIAYIAAGHERIETVAPATGEISQLLGPEVAAEQRLPEYFHVCCDPDHRSYWLTCRTHASHNTAEIFLASSDKNVRSIKRITDCTSSNNCYSSAFPSPDGKLCAILRGTKHELTSDNFPEHTILFRDQSGKMIETGLWFSAKTPSSPMFVAVPRWSHDGKRLFYALLQDDQVRLYEFDIESHGSRPLAVLGSEIDLFDVCWR